MTQALLTILPLAVAIAIFPVPIVAAVLLVGSERGHGKCLVFVVGWCVGLLAVGAIALLLAGVADASDDAETATWVKVILFCLGTALVVAAVPKWRGRPKSGEEAPVPNWMSTIDDFTVAKAGIAGFALSGLNPKNVALAAAAAAEIAAFGLQAEQQIAAVLVFTCVASLGVATPLVVSLALGARSRAVLDALKNWMARNNAVIMAVLFAAIGVKLVVDAVVGFV
jgi:threonine/homoserine/homoserine lactone efflux protein